MKNSLVTIFILFGFHLLHAQESDNTIKLLVSARVDTSKSDVRDVIILYENYYRSQPDSIYDNPYWNSKEKSLYKDFDFSRASIFQANMSAEELFQYFSPIVLSVEPIGEKYQIRVLFSSSTTDPAYAGSKVWCIQKLNAIKEGNSWVLENLIVELSKDWSHQKIGCINYLYPPDHIFNLEEAKHAEEFCNQIIKRFNPDFNESFKFYIAKDIDDMGLLENFDYYFVGITTGKAREGMILTAKGNEFFPHEFVHKLLISNPRRGHLIEEGLASFLGTKSNQKEYDELMNKLAIDLTENPEKINFKSVLTQEVRFNGYQTAYPAGAAICELVYEQKKDDGLIKLLQAKTETYQEIIAVLSSITNLTEIEIEKEWMRIVKNYDH